MAGVTSKEDKIIPHLEAAVERIETLAQDDGEGVEDATAVQYEHSPLERNLSADRQDEPADESVSGTETAAQARSAEHQSSQPNPNSGGEWATKPGLMTDQVYTEIHHDMDRQSVLESDIVNDQTPGTSSIAIRKGTAGPVYPGLRATDWDNHVSPKPPSSSAVITILVIMGFCLGGLGFFGYWLKIQIDNLGVAVSALTEKTDNVGENLQEGLLEKYPAFWQMDNRVNGLTAMVNRMNGALVGLDERIGEELENRNGALSEDEFKAVADRVLSLQTEIGQLKSAISIRQGQTQTPMAAAVKTNSNPPNPSNENVPETPKPQTLIQDKTQTALWGNDKSQEWILNLASSQEKEAVEALRAKYEAKGIETHLTKVMIGDREWYRLRVLGFASKKEAVQFGERATKILGLERYWISR